MFSETIINQFPSFLVFLAIFIAVTFTIIFLPIWIRILKVRQIGQQVRADGPQHHFVKQGTPTMGGVVILLAVVVTVAVIGSHSTPEKTIPLVLMILVTLLTGAIGFIDDLSKVVKERSLGLKPNAKMLSLTLIAIVFCLAAVNFAGIEPTITIPFIATFDLGFWTTTINLGETSFSIPWVYLIFVLFLMVGLSNAVNLVDGLDGLAAGAMMIAMIAMAVISYRADQLNLALFAAAVTGACVGFLWFNAHPASIFMGDTSSLALGAGFAALAVLTKTEVASLVIGGLFVLEALSVMIQVGYYKLTKKRVFLMAPLHHHFEQKGWSETTVVIRFWIISALFAALGFAMYFGQSLAIG